ncbi:MAG TPA: mechanosensitive ion channel domain-containing protein [Acidimicrobiales bacterium]|nr:mechanosensitive ion channel domain-containing protein [Acidimicrobiales bacterium]
MDDHGYVYDLLRKWGMGDFGASTWEFLLVRPLKIALLVVIGIVVARIGARAVRRFVRTLGTRAPVHPGSVRSEQRISTVGKVLGGMVRAVVWIIVLLVVLGEVGVDLAPLLAGAGIAGIAIGFGAQSLVKDFLSGFFILLEDQYGVGDVINLGDATGTVEDISLRVTRLRATDGTVWFVPNGEIKRVGNTSMEWSRALIDVQVAYDSDLAAVTSAIAEVAGTFADDATWHEAVLEPPEVWGVQAMGPDGLTIRLVVKTAPRQQYAVARELRGRITDRLRRDGVRGPGQTLQTVLVTAGALDSGTPPVAPSDVPGGSEGAGGTGSAPGGGSGAATGPAGPAGPASAEG